LCDRKPGDILAWRDGQAVYVGQFLEEMDQLARRLPATGPAINLCANRYRFLLSFAALIQRGQVNLLPANRSQGHLRALREQHPACYSIGDDSDVDWRMPSLSGSNAAATESPRVAEEQLAAVTFTSGSTGQPRANPKPWAELVAGARINATRLLDGMGHTVNLLATVPPQHMWGLETSIMLPLFAEVAISDRTPFYAADVAACLAALEPPRILVSTPLHLAAMVASYLQFPACARVLSATAPLDPELAGQVESLFDSELLEVFGCSEAGICATRRTAAQKEWTLMPGFELRPHGQGHRFHAPHLSGKAVPGDRFTITGAHSFTWEGRDEDQVKIAGKRASLADLNLKLQSVAGVRDGVVFLPQGDSQRLAGLVVAPGLERTSIERALRGLIDPVFIPRPLLLVDELPRSSNGKLSRAERDRLFAELVSRTRQGQPS
jgi:acyl-coenzyme A synthetase/AMP-(fatty) acid ligase